MPNFTKRRRNYKVHTRKNYITHLKNLYPVCKFDKNVNDNELYANHKITYGEMEYQGIQQLYSYLNKNYNPKIKCFIDIGSGRGKLCMYMAAQPKIASVLGIELVTQRNNDAIVLKNELNPDYANKVELLNKNIFDVDLTKYKNTDTFVWFSNLCFDQSTTNNIFEKLQNELQKGTILCCSKKSDPPIGEFLTSVSIPMSWNKSSNVFIYRL
jgi:hypothetical protein